MVYNKKGGSRKQKNSKKIIKEGRRNKKTK